jgi:hypothetical protein
MVCDAGLGEPWMIWMILKVRIPGFDCWLYMKSTIRIYTPLFASCKGVLHPSYHNSKVLTQPRQHGYVKTAVRSFIKLATKRCQKLGRELPKWCSKAGCAPRKTSQGIWRGLTMFNHQNSGLAWFSPLRSGLTNK